MEYLYFQENNSCFLYTVTQKRMRKKDYMKRVVMGYGCKFLRYNTHINYVVQMFRIISRLKHPSGPIIIHNNGV